MSVGAQIDKFYSDVRENQCLWYVEDAHGKRMEFDVAGNKVAFPVWSSKSRILRLKKLNPDLMGDVSPKGISLNNFLQVLVPELLERDRLISLNLSGKNLTGFDLQLSSVVKNLSSIAE